MAKAGTELPVFDYREGGEIPRSPSFPQICTLVLLCGHAPDIDRHASDVRNVLKPDISLRQGEKTFQSNTIRPQFTVSGLKSASARS